MKIDHITIWTEDIETMKEYYIKHFGATSNDIYINESTGFRSYFLSFDDGSRLEIMQREDIPANANDTIGKQYRGIIHMAFRVNSKEEVDNKMHELSADGHRILRGPRTSGDGYYEFETIDPENNRLEVIYKS